MSTVTPASRADIDDLSRLLALSFQFDPPSRAVLQPRDDQDMLVRAFHLFRAMLAAGPVDRGMVDTIRDGEDILGVAVWEAPGDKASSSPRSYLNHLPDYVKAIGWTGLPRAIGIQTSIARHKPGVPAWYLHAIGVSPQARGRGVASQLLEYRLATVDQRREPAYLESSTALTGKLYRRHGFQTLRPIPITAEAKPHAMWRPARTA
ncbi:GNAT family N-acetyltransferase [Kocuria sp.]|uniref:GNAT family N-acetyltransferase n=1 Tax=Kocuria sp. TaxID=1871328 RepID=UPI0026DFE746|nr:GNAT family N-acetyltransferase [Kocuria sp.]MDO5618501.1 GNAT family N-acetyltransferase [Kocuria sp.]